MGALKYVEELHKKKQSDVLRFLLRVRCWEVSIDDAGYLVVVSVKPRKRELPAGGMAPLLRRTTVNVAHALCLAIHSVNLAESASI
jgi:hypothetical protein